MSYETIIKCDICCKRLDIGEINHELCIEETEIKPEYNMKYLVDIDICDECWKKIGNWDINYILDQYKNKD
jgi:hypothetical protein